MRKIPHGTAAVVTDAIRVLQRTPLPYLARPVPTGRPDTYELLVEGYVVTYEVVERERIVRILAVEPAPTL
jgi:mRNA-degrading endonuclease RelE of RelBE toxin-antitoxin system